MRENAPLDMQHSLNFWEVGNQLISTELLLQVWHNESTFAIDNTVQKFIFIVVKMPKMFFCYSHPEYMFCQLFCNQH